ncbi:N-methyl-L-tryptophan oxidase [Amycolatopsis sp. CA-230715]|uniref:N-methyl-L-tryptophan oxidase n=1 Tax=Amycolatopsis sp. CA-230715 TaxID=2745196 RepID=UPI001C02BCF1|nr:N-methyl-L-tryptophan oxidase [Amycolatopsis sp. CA-230715]QWF82240.1 Monomeric sarcosine oxidase [Amycolatopsis sp. CA-230715]
MTGYDTIVIGLGGMGSAAAYRLARRGQRVLGIEQYAPVHNRGSSHGGSRITRQAYFEDPAYVPLLLRAHELWDEIEADSGRRIFGRCGGITVGKPDSRPFAGSLRSARQWDLPHEVLDADGLRERVPTMRPADDDVALYEPNAGFVVPEASVAAHLQLAKRAGADLRYEEKVVTWTSDPSGVRVGTAQNYYTADQLVLCPGAWAPELLSGLGVPLRVQRRVQYWFAPTGDPAAFLPERHPVFLWQDTGKLLYGFPAHNGPGEGVKIAFFGEGGDCTPDTIDRRVHAGEVAEIGAHAGARIPALPGRFLRAVTCMYTSTPDEHFVISRHPSAERVVVACGFSGHGFKFTPVVGEVLADLVTEGGTAHPISLFDPARFRHEECA